MTVFPVCPICRLYGTQPASAAAREAPTAPPSARARGFNRRIERFRAAEPTPARHDDGRLLERQFAGALLDIALDRGSVAAGGLLERARSARRFRRVRPRTRWAGPSTMP